MSVTFIKNRLQKWGGVRKHMEKTAFLCLVRKKSKLREKEKLN